MCLMSQSWDNVANSYALAFNSKLTCSEIIWCTYTDESSKNLVSTMAQVTPLDAGQQQLVELTTAMVIFLLCSNIESTTWQTIDKHDKEQTSPIDSLEAWWPAKRASQNARCFMPFIQECISMPTLVCAHSTATRTNRGPSEPEHIFYALQVRT